MGMEALRARLMSSLTVALGVGCGPSVPPDDGEGSTSTGTDMHGSSGAGVTSTFGGSTGAEAEVDVDVDSGVEPPEPDIGGTPPPEPGCPPQPPLPVEECTVELPPDARLVFYCIDPAEGQTCEAWAQGFETTATPEWVAMVAECLDYWCAPEIEAIGCGPLPDTGDQCCFWFIDVSMPCPPEGRPFVIDGRERLAMLADRDDWAGGSGGFVVAEPTMHRTAIAAAWAEQALAEHASIAAFARFILQLLACGAPPSLVSSANVALGEEIEHAQLCFALASRFAGRAIGPTALDVHGALAGSDDFDEVVLATVREGCIAETISAWRITLAARYARDPSLAAALERMAAQELEHAALAWRLLAWALPRASASLRQRVATTLREPARHVPRAPALAVGVPDREWRAHGILPRSEHAAAAQHALRELVAPLTDALLGEQVACAWAV